MSNYFLEDLDYQWRLVRETPHSQKFAVDIMDAQRDVMAMFDIHYTRPDTVHVSVCFIGEKYCFTDGLQHWLFFDLEKIIKRNGPYKVIDYTLTFAPEVREGSFAIEY